MVNDSYGQLFKLVHTVLLKAIGTCQFTCPGWVEAYRTGGNLMAEQPLKNRYKEQRSTPTCTYDYQRPLSCSSSTCVTQDTAKHHTHTIYIHT